MKIEVYSLYDKQIERFMQPPIFCRDEKEAIAIVDRAGLPATIRQSVTLFKCGTFDDKTGMFEAVDPVRICNFFEVAEEKQDGEEGRTLE